MKERQVSCKMVTQPYGFETFARFYRLREDCHIVLSDGIWNNCTSYSVESQNHTLRKTSCHYSTCSRNRPKKSLSRITHSARLNYKKSAMTLQWKLFA